MAADRAWTLGSASQGASSGASKGVVPRRRGVERSRSILAPTAVRDCPGLLGPGFRIATPVAPSESQLQHEDTHGLSRRRTTAELPERASLWSHAGERAEGGTYGVQGRDLAFRQLTFPSRSSSDS
jgi:hypothetical protein